MVERTKSIAAMAGNQIAGKKNEKPNLGIKKNNKPDLGIKKNSEVAPEQLEDENKEVAPEQLSENDNKSEKVAPVQLSKKPKKQPSSNQIMSLSEITPWGFADRPENEFGSDEEWHEFVQSIAKEGVDQPVTVRKKKGGKGYELICGRRRWTASIECGNETIPVIVRDLDDKEAAMLQDRENEKRKDLSVWARAQNWKKLLDEGVFKRQEDLAVAVSMEKSKVSKILSYNKIPQEIADSIENKSNVGIKLAQAILSAVKVSDAQPQSVVKSNVETIVSIGDKISSGDITVAKMKAILTKSEKDNKTEEDEPEFDTAIGTVKGVKCFNVRRDSNGTPVISILKEARDLVSVKDIAEHLEMLFEDSIK